MAKELHAVVEPMQKWVSLVNVVCCNTLTCPLFKYQTKSLLSSLCVQIFLHFSWSRLPGHGGIPVQRKRLTKQMTQTWLMSYSGCRLLRFIYSWCLYKQTWALFVINFFSWFCRYFSNKPGSYYSDSLFFLSIAIHRVMPDSLDKVVMLDADLKFKSDIINLYNLFEDFSDEAILGMDFVINCFHTCLTAILPSLYTHFSLSYATHFMDAAVRTNSLLGSIAII